MKPNNNWRNALEVDIGDFFDVETADAKGGSWKNRKEFGMQGYQS